MAINGVRGLTRANSSMSLGKAGALQSADDDTMSRGGSPAEDVFVDHDGSRAARFSTELVGNRFREVGAAMGIPLGADLCLGSCKRLGLLRERLLFGLA